MSRPVADEERLASRAAAGDEAAFTDLVRRILPRLRRWALVRTADADEADEVVQETLIRMHAGLARFEGASRLSSWAYRILANVATDRARAERAASAKAAGAAACGAAERIEAEPDPVSRLHARRLAAVVVEFFGTLPARQREVLELVDHQGLRPAEAAETLDMNPVTVRVHLLRARRALRARILERYPTLMEGYEP